MKPEMKLRVRAPATCESERRWIISQLFERFACDLDVLLERREGWEVEVVDADGSVGFGKVGLPDVFFSTVASRWLSEQGMPSVPLPSWELSDTPFRMILEEDEIPVLFGGPGHVMVSRNEGWLNVDIFGSAFFMLSRYEEIVEPARDEHDRFPAGASLAYRGGFLSRPIVDEYMEILRVFLCMITGRLMPTTTEPRTLVSCDVDQPYESYVNDRRRMLRKAGGDLLKRRDVREFRTTIRNYVSSRHGDYSDDPLNSFDWIMDVNEAVGNSVTFYFMSTRSALPIDGGYDIFEPRIRALLRKIHHRGHVIGLHGSYQTYRDGRLLALEAERLQRVLEEEKIQQEVLCARQHYLRWAADETGRALEEAEIEQDSTLGYADAPGFRCGTCHRFTLYDLDARRPLAVREEPLVVMECTVIDPLYLGLGCGDRAAGLMRHLKEAAGRVRGGFSLLWHNNHLVEEAPRRLYRRIIA